MSQLVYDNDGIQLWLGVAENLDMLPDEAVNLTITSPPYNIKNPSTGKTDKSPKAWRVQWYPDDMPEPEYQRWQIDVLNEVWRVTKNGGSLFYNHKVRGVNGRGIHPWSWISQSKWELVQQIVWDRNDTNNHGATRFFPVDELIFWLCKGDPYTNKESGFAKYSTVWRIGYSRLSQHPAPFPIELPTRCIQACSKEGDLVLDCFSGSGTTMVAARNLNRRGIGVEKNDVKWNHPYAMKRLGQTVIR